MAASSRSARDRSSDIAATQSVAAQRVPRVSSRRTARRNESGREGDDGDDCEHARQDRRLRGSHAVEKAGDGAKGGQRHRETESDSPCHEHTGSPEDHRQYLTWRCSDRDSYSDLTRSLSDRKTDQAVKADGGNEHGRHAQDGRQCCHQPFLTKRIVYAGINGLHVKERQRRVQCPQFLLDHTQRRTCDPHAP